jgi:hypothetical protein
LEALKEEIENSGYTGYKNMAILGCRIKMVLFTRDSGTNLEIPVLIFCATLNIKIS